MDIEANLTAYLGQRRPATRYTSFDYCYNHFQAHRERGTLSELVVGPNMQPSCLHLGFYLASWGMLRPSSVLLQRSVKHDEPVIQVIASSPSEIWSVDANSYTEANCSLVSETARQIRGALPDGASDVLVTKIMLGVFGCVPAFDRRNRSFFNSRSASPLIPKATVCLWCRALSSPGRRPILIRCCTARFVNRTPRGRSASRAAVARRHRTVH